MDSAMTFAQVLTQIVGGEDIFDTLTDTVCFLKDAQGRYKAVNQTLVERTGRHSKAELLNHTADEIFPGELGLHIAAQDKAIMEGGRRMTAELELHLGLDGQKIWCLTWKSPLRNPSGKVVGLFGMSRDIRMAHEGFQEAGALSQALAYARQHFNQPLRVSDLAARAGLSDFQFDQRVRQLFGVTAGQFLTRLRIDHALDRLRHSQDSLVEIALDCGYSDQTAFTRQFRKLVRLTPAQYRARI